MTLITTQFQGPSIAPRMMLRNFKPDKDQQGMANRIYRSETCALLSAEVVCSSCKDSESSAIKSERGSTINSSKPAKLKTPVSITLPERLRLTLQDQRKENKHLLQMVAKLQEIIEKKSKPVSPADHADFQEIFNAADKKFMPPFMKFFWEEQQKYVVVLGKSMMFLHMVHKGHILRWI